MKRLVGLAALAACGSDPAPPPAACFDETPALAFTEVALVNGEIAVTALAFVPGTDELIVVEKSGRLSHYRLDGDGLALLGELQLPDVRDDEDCGAHSIAFDPVDDRYLYAAHCLRGSGSNRIVRLDFQPPDYAATLASLVTILDIGDPEIPGSAKAHNLGRLVFDDDGNLYVPAGDRTLRARAPDLASNLGKILRIVPSREPAVGGYTAAPGNPFDSDVYALGLRSPWTMTRDHLGRLWVGDVGSDEAEEIDLVGAGDDLGWPAREGPCADDDACDGVVDPAFWWDRSSGHAYVQADPGALPSTRRVAWVGPEYRGSAIADPYAGRLDDTLLFGDICTGFVRAVRLDDDGEVCDAHVGHFPGVTDMRQGPDGYLYAVTFGTCLSTEDIPPGRMWRVELAN